MYLPKIPDSPSTCASRRNAVLSACEGAELWKEPLDFLTQLRQEVVERTNFSGDSEFFFFEWRFFGRFEVWKSVSSYEFFFCVGIVFDFHAHKHLFV